MSSSPFSTEHNKAVVKKYFDNYWREINVSIVSGARDGLTAGRRDLPRRLNFNIPVCPTGWIRSGRLCGRVQGRENAKALLTALKASFPDVSFKPLGPLIAGNLPEGDFVVGRFEGGGTHSGPPISLAIGSLKEVNTGKKMWFTGTTVWRLKDGLIIEEIGEEGAIDAVRRFGLYEVN